MTLPIAGYVYYDSKFTFPDGGTKGKYFVVLCDSPRDISNVLVARITSQDKSDPIPGCHSSNKYETVFFIPNGTSVLVKDSWIQFNYLVEYRSVILEGWTRVGQLSLQLTKDMLLCGSSSYTIDNWQKEALADWGNRIQP